MSSQKTKNIDLINPNPRKGLSIPVNIPYSTKNLRIKGKAVSVTKKKSSQKTVLNFEKEIVKNQELPKEKTEQKDTFETTEKSTKTKNPEVDEVTKKEREIKKAEKESLKKQIKEQLAKEKAEKIKEHSKEEKEKPQKPQPEKNTKTEQSFEEIKESKPFEETEIIEKKNERKAKPVIVKIKRAENKKESNPSDQKDNSNKDRELKSKLLKLKEEKSPSNKPQVVRKINPTQQQCNNATAPTEQPRINQNIEKQVQVNNNLNRPSVQTNTNKSRQHTPLPPAIPQVPINFASRRQTIKPAKIEPKNKIPPVDFVAASEQYLKAKQKLKKYIEEKGKQTDKAKKQIELRLHTKDIITEEIGKIKKRGKRKIKNVFAASILAFLLPIVFFWGITPSLPKEITNFSSDKQVLGASETNVFESSMEESEYKNWASQKSDEQLEPTEDNDSDGLTNIEEFWLDTDPTDKYTCKNKNTDAQNLFNLINPKTGEPVDFDNEEEVRTISKVINLPHIQEEIQEEYEKNQDSTEKVPTSSLYSVFGVTNLNQIDTDETDKIHNDIITAQKQKEYLQTIQKIDEYITKYRSYGPYDRNYDTPVNPAIYLEVSLQYDTPLKYVMAIARLESRFGTDRFTDQGIPTRIHQHNNIYSMGLDDSGNNWTFAQWEGSVEEFGRWYQRFEDRGISDCSKWRIYNPNGDYCSKVEKLASEIDAYLNREI